LDAFVFAARQLTFDRTILVDKASSQSEAGRATLTKSEFDQPALTRENFRRKLAAIFPRHGTLDALDDGRERTSVIVKLLGTVLNRDAGPLADVLVVSALVRILEASPAADIVDKNSGEVDFTGFDIGDQSLQRVAPFQAQPALAFVGIGPDDLDVTAGGEQTDDVRLILRRVSLMLCRHAYVLSRSL
jgi:hypothetical protein